jgi:hypothetical protein
MPKIIPVNNFKYGIISSLEESNIPREASSDSLNWLTGGSFIELRRGLYRLGLTEVSGAGKVTGGIVAKRADGVEIPFRSRGRKVEYYDITTDEWIEIGTDVLPATVITTADPYGEQITFASISTVTGPQVWLNSPHAGLHKIMVASPGSITAMYDGTKNYRGHITIKGDAIWLWNARIDNKIPDLTNIYRSYLANKSTADFTQISAEACAGTGATRTGTLAFKAAGAKRTCFEVTFTDGTETFIDDLSGNLIGSAGGTGTINYTTGAYSVTFAAPATTVTATYRWEDSTAGGLADFTFSGTRTSGQGFVLRQQDGGSPMKNVFYYSGVYYCIHESKTWSVSISADDLTFTNLPYRNKVGITSILGAIDSDDGVYYVDDTDANDPQIRILSLNYSGLEVIPSSVSKKFEMNKVKVGIDLSSYSFNKAVVRRFGNLVVVSCRKTESNENDTLIVINKDSGAIDILGYIYANNIDIYNGALIAGDSISNNTYTLFTGTDDQDSEIINYWIGKMDNLDVEQLKVCKKLMIEGNIGPDTSLKVYVSIDSGAFVEILDTNGDPFIKGDGSYVDKSQSIDVGSYTLGRGEVGGGGDGLVAYHYMRELKINQEKFYQIKLKFEAYGIGYVSITQYQLRDVRGKWQKLPVRYRG